MLPTKSPYCSDEQINDLDWTSTTDFQSILAVGFSQHVVLLCQQRMTYFNEEPAWGTLGKIDIGQSVLEILLMVNGYNITKVCSRIPSKIRFGLLGAPS